MNLEPDVGVADRAVCRLFLESMRIYSCDLCFYKVIREFPTAELVSLTRGSP